MSGCADRRRFLERSTEEADGGREPARFLEHLLADPRRDDVGEGAVLPHDPQGGALCVGQAPHGVDDLVQGGVDAALASDREQGLAYLGNGRVGETATRAMKRCLHVAEYRPEPHSSDIGLEEEVGLGLWKEGQRAGARGLQFAKVGIVGTGC